MKTIFFKLCFPYPTCFRECNLIPSQKAGLAFEDLALCFEMLRCSRPTVPPKGQMWPPNTKLWFSVHREVDSVSVRSFCLLGKLEIVNATSSSDMLYNMLVKSGKHSQNRHKQARHATGFCLCVQITKRGRGVGNSPTDKHFKVSTLQLHTCLQVPFLKRGIINIR